MQMTTIGLVDDHTLLRDALIPVIQGFGDCNVTVVANDGVDLLEKLIGRTAPDIILLDINMPRMDGFATTAWLQVHAPETKVLILTMYDHDITLIRLLRAGVRGLLKKDITPDELKNAIYTVRRTGYYYDQNMTGRLLHMAQAKIPAAASWELQQAIDLSENELIFLKWACSDLTYKEIAQKMDISARTVDNYRDALFEKMGVKSRTGLAILALKNGMITL